MPWSHLSVMDTNALFIGDNLRQALTFSELCARHGISCKTGYKSIVRNGNTG